VDIKAKEISLVPISEIKLNPKNRNKHPKEQIDRLVDILKYQGFRRPVSISNRTGHLVCGEGRYLAAKKLKMESIPAIFQDYESEQQEFSDAIADNAIDKWAELDHEGII
jgi:ParB-like chromosome segregation protein Spo0J